MGVYQYHYIVYKIDSIGHFDMQADNLLGYYQTLSVCGGVSSEGDGMVEKAWVICA